MTIKQLAPELNDNQRKMLYREIKRLVPVRPIPKQTELQKMLPEINSTQLKWLEEYIRKQVSDRVAERIWQLTGGGAV